MTTNPFAVHVERVADPHELRWVMNWPELASSPDGRRVPQPSSALGRLLSSRSIASVRVLRGDLIVRTAVWDGALAAQVHEAVVVDRHEGAPWWFEAAADVAVRPR